MDIGPREKKGSEGKLLRCTYLCTHTLDNIKQEREENKVSSVSTQI